MATERKILGAVAVNGTVYTAGQEAELAAAADAAGHDLTGDRYVGSLEGDWKAARTAARTDADTAPSSGAAKTGRK